MFLRSHCKSLWGRFMPNEVYIPFSYDFWALTLQLGRMERKKKACLSFLLKLLNVLRSCLLLNIPRNKLPYSSFKSRFFFLCTRSFQNNKLTSPTFFVNQYHGNVVIIASLRDTTPNSYSLGTRAPEFTANSTSITLYCSKCDHLWKINS